jgi:L-asparaginase II
VTAAAVLARVVRSGLEESIHLGHVAVCDADGRLLASAGDPHQAVFARSSMKPVQAAVSLEAIGDALPDPAIAIMCASHNGETVHVEAVGSLLAEAGLSPEALRCPPGWPLLPEAMAQAVRPGRELHNCSGKHAGMLLACVRAGWNPKTYERASHPLQRRVLATVLRASGQRSTALGVDGCGVPVHGMPLSTMATLYARLARPAWFGDLEAQVEMCTRSMRGEPYLVAGKGRLDTELMIKVGGIVVKGGAEGLVCAALLGPGVGVAVKGADGAWRGTGPALIRALRSLDAISDAQLRRLSAFARPPVKGGGKVVGEIVSDLDLHRR